MEKFWTEYNDKGNFKRCFVFDGIADNNLAYFVGYMACDGAFVYNRGFSFMSVNSTEEYIICKFKEEYAPDNTIYFKGKVSSQKVKAVSDVWEIRFSPRMKTSFSKFGIFDYKRNRRVVGIPKKFFKGYLRGVIDADGFITVSHRKDCRTPRLRWFITHESKTFLLDLQRFVDEYYQVPTTVAQTGEKVWRLQAQNTTKNIEFLRDIFSVELDVYNNRKANVVKSYLDKYVPQKSGELLETLSQRQSAAKPSETEGSETT